ncbi:MAG: serine/threonine-protein kinase RsbT [Burkholderiaceae bacterium]|jgi:serine/threonine-protein kinase RsbT
MNRTETICIRIASDIATASRTARQAAEQAGFDRTSSYQIATAAAELACNVLVHGGGGMVTVCAPSHRSGVELLATDSGPGIADLGLAMQDGYSSTGSLGCGLSGVERLMDEVVIETGVGTGTTVRASKWR